MTSPTNDIAAHPHRPVGRVPVAIPGDTLFALSTIQPGKALQAMIEEWAIITAAIALAIVAEHWAVSVAAIMLIASRQHALAILAHDAAHYRFLPGRKWNDLLGNLFLAWPVFISLALFRSFHGPHHRFTGDRTDGNRIFWRSHDKSGNLTKEWSYPMSAGRFLLIVARRAAIVHGLLWIAGGTGLQWVFRGLPSRTVLGGLWSKILTRFAYYGAILAAAWALGALTELALYWLLPYCTWHIVAQYIRVICEHSGKIGERAEFAWTRSTQPGLLGRIFILPRHVGYHIEHHWYPSVPWYNLPALHHVLREDPLFAAHANVQHSILASLSQCLITPAQPAGERAKS